MYCFTVPSEFLIFRRNGNIFCSGNTGKTKVGIDTAAWLYAQGKIDFLLVAAPNGVHVNWVDVEIPIHMPDWVPHVTAAYKASPKKVDRERMDKLLDPEVTGLRVLAINVEALSNQKGKASKLVVDILRYHNVMWIMDESTRIKNPSAKRTKNIIRLGRGAKYRRIMTGLPIPQGPLDFYSQFKFMDERILEYSTYTGFRAHYAVLRSDSDPLVMAIRRKGARGPVHLVQEDSQGRPMYRNMGQLQARVAKWSYRATKADCLDLPEKVYETRMFEITPEQRKLYDGLLKETVVALQGNFGADVPDGMTDDEALVWLVFDCPKVKASLSITKYVRWQQIIGGFVGLDDGTKLHVFDKNPKLDLLIETIGDMTGKVIVWARFRKEIEMISDRLVDIYGPRSVVEYHGGVGVDDRTENVARFQGDPDTRFFVGQAQSGGIGLTLTAATNVVYYSNSFDLEQRMQSEDRAHRIGQTNRVLYVDLIAENTVDEKVVERLHQKSKTATDILDGTNG